MNQHVIIFSSARPDGNTRQAAETLAGKLDARVIVLNDYRINPYRYDLSDQADDFRPLVTELLAFKHWVFASPVYWYNTTPQMKAFFDRLTEYMDQPELREQLRQLRRKQASLLSTSYTKHAPHAFVDPFIHTVNYLGMEFVHHYHARDKAPDEVRRQPAPGQSWWRKFPALVGRRAAWVE